MCASHGGAPATIGVERRKRICAASCPNASEMLNHPIILRPPTGNAGHLRYAPTPPPIAALKTPHHSQTPAPCGSQPAGDLSGWWSASAGERAGHRNGRGPIGGPCVWFMRRCFAALQCALQHQFVRLHRLQQRGGTIPRLHLLGRAFPTHRHRHNEFAPPMVQSM